MHGAFSFNSIENSILSIALSCIVWVPGLCVVQCVRCVHAIWDHDRAGVHGSSFIGVWEAHDAGGSVMMHQCLPLQCGLQVRVVRLKLPRAFSIKRGIVSHR